MKVRYVQFLWALGFFGLPNNYSVILHKQIFDLCYYGNGFNQEGVYRLPIHIRNFYYRELLKAKKVEKENLDKNPQGKKTGPNIKVRK